MELTTTIEFKSLPEFYEKEADGRKSNTTRFVSEKEDAIIQDRFNDIKYIKIKNTNERYCKESFVRRLRDISRFKSCGQIIYIFSW